MVGDLHLHAYQKHFYRVDDLAFAADLGGIKKIFGYIGRLFKHGKEDESSQDSRPGEEFIKKTK
jgi:hypothetical protein